MAGVAHWSKAKGIGLFARFCGYVERQSGIPARFSVPFLWATFALVVSGTGTHTDIAQHIDMGRDKTGFSIPHTFMLYGLSSLSFAAILHGRMAGPSVPGERHIMGMRFAPGALQGLAAGALAALGLPLDVLWHLAFGPDVSLWGPIHLFMEAGASFGVIGYWMLICQGRKVGNPTRLWRGHTLPAAGLLVGIAAFLLEYDFGVPQFQLVLQPVLIVFSASLCFVAARILSGPGGAIRTFVWYLILRTLLYTVVVGLVVQYSQPTQPLWLISALCVEVAALATIRRPNRFVLVSAVLIATVGFGSEWAWTYVYSAHPWTIATVVSAFPLVVLASFSGAVIGGRMAQAMLGEGGATAAEAVRPRPSLSPAMVATAAVAGLASLAIGLPRTNGDGTRATVVPTPDERRGWVNLDVRIDPPSAPRDSQWFEVLSWQGQDRRRLTDLKEIGPGHYVTEQAVPVTGTWKTLLRLARGSNLMGVPVYLPPEPLSKRDGVPVRPHVNERMRGDTYQILREAWGSPTWAKFIAYPLVVAGLTLFLGLTAWSLRVLERGDGAGPPRRRRRTRAGWLRAQGARQ